MITGAGGLVGRALTDHCTAQGDDLYPFDHHALDIADSDSVNAAVRRVSPDVVINCAAWTDVDGCESDPARAERVNAQGPELLANASREAGALLITISTDYVFDGRKEGFYTQRDQPNPLSIYGRSKLEGEYRALRAWARTIVVRSGYIFGAGGNNFLSTFLGRIRRGDSLKAISDIVGTPTYAPDLAQRLRRLAQLDLPGTYHAVNSGAGASFEEFARTAVKIAGLNDELLQGTTLQEMNRPADRPRNSRLRCLLSEAMGLEPLPNWEEALRRFIAARLNDRQPSG